MQNLSIKAAAARMGCSPQTVRRLIGEGRLEAFRYRDGVGHLYVSLGSIEDFMNAVRITPDDLDDDDIEAMAC